MSQISMAFTYDTLGSSDAKDILSLDRESTDKIPADRHMFASVRISEMSTERLKNCCDDWGVTQGRGGGGCLPPTIVLEKNDGRLTAFL